MFVAESNIFDPGNIKLKVSNMNGVDIELEVSPEILVDHLKIQISSHLFDAASSVKESLYHRVLHINSGVVLDEEKSLTQCGVKDQDELLLIRKRTPAPSLEGMETKIREDSRKTPTAEDVKQATQGIASLNTDRPKPDILQPSNFKEELRKILISLIDAAQKILCLNPEAAKIFEDAGKCISDQKSVITDTPTVDQSAVDQLVAMGFPESRAKRALIKTQMSTEHAIQWLIEHESDPDIDQSEELPKALPTPAVVTDNAQSEGAIAPADSENEALRLAQMAGPEKVTKMLDAFRAYRRREFKANPKALRILVEMGFDESDALDALCIHGNKQEEACDWLLSGGHLSGSQDLDLAGGLDPESPVYRAIMDNHVVQLGLGKPKSLLAFLMILENPNSTQQWINDPDTGPMLIQISRIYHAERHAQKTS